MHKMTITTARGSKIDLAISADGIEATLPNGASVRVNPTVTKEIGHHLTGFIGYNAQIIPISKSEHDEIVSKLVELYWIANPKSEEVLAMEAHKAEYRANYKRVLRAMNP